MTSYLSYDYVIEGRDKKRAKTINGMEEKEEKKLSSEWHTGQKTNLQGVYTVPRPCTVRFFLSLILLSGSARFQENGNITVRLDAVFRYCKSYGAVWCGFDTVRFGAVFKNRKCCGGCFHVSYGTVRCGFQK